MQEVQAAVPARGVNRMQAGMRRRRAGARAAAEEDDEAAVRDILMFLLFDSYVRLTHDATYLQMQEDEADVEVEPVATRRDVRICVSFNIVVK